MSDTASLSAVQKARKLEVETVMKRIREIAANGIDRGVLDQVKEELKKLAVRQDLFPLEEFDAVFVRTDTSMYRLSVDPDHRYALYLSRPAPGRSTPPHDHKTWAVIAGIRGREHNRLYRRMPASAADGTQKVEVERERELDVVSGVALALMPEDVHSIHLGDDGPHMNLHLYGMSIEHIDNRTSFDLQTGATKTFPAASGVKVAAGGV